MAGELIERYIAQRQAQRPDIIRQAGRTGMRAGLAEGLKTLASIFLEQQKLKQQEKEASQKAKEAEKQIRKEVSEMLFKGGIEMVSPAVAEQPAIPGQPAVPGVRVPSPITTGLPERLAIQEPISTSIDSIGIEKRGFPYSLFQVPSQLPAQTLTPFQRPPITVGAKPEIPEQPSIPGQPEKVGGLPEYTKFIETGVTPPGFEWRGKPSVIAPEGFEITGYDTKGNPIIRKIQQPINIYWSDPVTKKITSATTGKEVSSVPKSSKILAIPGTKQSEQKSKDIENLNVTVSSMKGLLDKIPSAEGIRGRMLGAIERGKAMAGYSKELKIYNDYRKVILGQLSKTIGGETGSRISDQDVIRMQKALPSEFETTSERQLKWKTFGDTVNEISRNYGGSDVFDNTGNLINLGNVLSQTQKQKTFNSIEEAEKMNLPKGTIIYIKSKRAVIE